MIVTIFKCVIKCRIFFFFFFSIQKLHIGMVCVWVHFWVKEVTQKHLQLQPLEKRVCITCFFIKFVVKW